MKFQITLRPSVVSLRRPFFQSLISLLRLSHLDGDFSMLGMCLRQIYKLSKCQSQQWSHCSVREQQQEESCVSHVKICGCCEEKLQSCCALGRGQSSVGGWGWRCLLLDIAIPAGKNIPELQQYRCFWNHLNLCMLGRVMSISDEHVPTKRAPFLSPGTGLTFTGLLGMV